MHSCLACSGLQLLFQTCIWGSCQDTQGTTASCYKVLLCAGRAQPGRAGSGLCQRGSVIQRVWPVEGCWGSHCMLPSLHTRDGGLAACLWSRTSWVFLLSWMSAVLGLWMWLVCWAEPWVTTEHPSSACLFAVADAAGVCF